MQLPRLSMLLPAVVFVCLCVCVCVYVSSNFVCCEYMHFWGNHYLVRQVNVRADVLCN